MKTRNFLFVLVLCLHTIVATTTAQQPSFQAASVKHALLSFTIPNEVNVRYYRIEASNDSMHFEVVATLPSKGNSVLQRRYCFDLTAYSYKYYQVGMVKMSGDIPYSTIVKKGETSDTTPASPVHKPCHDNTGCLVAR